MFLWLLTDCEALWIFPQLLPRKMHLIFLSSGVYKGLHHTRTTSTSPIPMSNPHQCNTPTSNSNNGTSLNNHHVGSASPAPAQVLLAGAMRLGVTSPGAPLSVRHLQRQLTVPTSALKLAASANRQLPKVTSGSATLDMGTRSVKLYVWNFCLPWLNTWIDGKQWAQ